MKIILPEYIENCIKTINNNGYEAFCVGGAIRNILLNISPKDFDIATSAPASRILNMFEKTIPTGIKHGTVTVIIDSHPVEITTYRSETEYSDFRHPNKIEFVNNITEDLKRRDFTINSLAFNKEQGLIDLYGGVSDLNKRVIRTVGNPNERFKEDPLRILRCFRFATNLDFNIEETTLASAKKFSYLLDKISVERIFSELKKIFLSKKICILNNLLEEQYFINLFGKKAIVPQNHENIESDFCKRFSYFCYYNNLNITGILNKLKSDNNTKNKCKLYFTVLNMKNYDSIIEFKRDISFIEYNDLIEVFKFKMDCLNDKTCFEYSKIIVANNEPYRTDMLNINGNDLKKLGIFEKEIKHTYKKLLEFCIINPNLNYKEKLIKIANNL